MAIDLFKLTRPTKEKKNGQVCDGVSSQGELRRGGEPNCRWKHSMAWSPKLDKKKMLRNPIVTLSFLNAYGIWPAAWSSWYYDVTEMMGRPLDCESKQTLLQLLLLFCQEFSHRNEKISITVLNKFKKLEYCCLDLTRNKLYKNICNHYLKGIPSGIFDASLWSRSYFHMSD